MAKSSRATSTKKNNRALKKHVFGPVEAARTERLSAKLLEIAAQPKPSRPGQEKEKEMEGVEGAPLDQKTASVGKDGGSMDIDLGAKTGSKKAALGRKGIGKRGIKKPSIVFPSYKDRLGLKKRR